MMGLGSMAKRDMKTVWKPKESDLSRTSTQRKATRTLPTLPVEERIETIPTVMKKYEAWALHPGTSHHPGTASLTGSSNNVAANPEEAEPSSTHLADMELLVSATQLQSRQPSLLLRSSPQLTNF